jgi:hypothetical protein
MNHKRAIDYAFASESNNMENCLKQTVNNFSQKKDSQSTMSYFSSGVISRADLKFRIRSHKKKQGMVFRNTMKDLNAFADMDTLLDTTKCLTAVS